MFFVPDGDHEYACKCAACSTVQPAVWALYSNLYNVDRDVAIKAMKADGSEDLYDDPFIDLELRLAAVLSSRYSTKVAEAEKLIREGMRSPFDRRRFDEKLAEAMALMTIVIDPTTDREIRRLVDRLMRRGARDADDLPAEEEVDEEEEEEEEEPVLAPLPGGGMLVLTGIAAGVLISGVFGRNQPGNRPVAAGTALEGSPSTQQVFDGIVRAAHYYTNRHFNHFIIPEIQRRVGLLLDGADPTTVPDLTDIERHLSRRLQSVPYWRMVANAAASRAYHYGMLKAGQLRQVRAYRIQAVLDMRTSAICREMHGKQFWLADAVKLMERVAAEEDPEMVKVHMPWLTNITGLNASSLRDYGCLVPPFHPNCRSTIIFIFSNGREAGGYRAATWEAPDPTR
jgi:hypothetical protein